MKTFIRHTKITKQSIEWHRHSQFVVVVVVVVAMFLSVMLSTVSAQGGPGDASDDPTLIETSSPSPSLNNQSASPSPSTSGSVVLSDSPTSAPDGISAVDGSDTPTTAPNSMMMPTDESDTSDAPTLAEPAPPADSPVDATTPVASPTGTSGIRDTSSAISTTIAGNIVATAITIVVLILPLSIGTMDQFY